MLKTILLTIASPVFALPFSFLMYLFFFVVYCPEITDPLYETMGSFKYSLRWAVRGPFYQVLILDTMLKRFYLSLPLLFMGNFALIFIADRIRARRVRFPVLLLGAGLYLTVVAFGGLWLGVWDEPFWT